MAENLVRLVVTCSARKSMEPVRPLMLQTLHEKDVRLKAKRWINLIESSNSPSMDAVSLYCGDHWSVVRSIEESFVRGDRRLETWICSAGYGLIRPSSSLKPYSATFTPGHPDTVAPQTIGDASAYHRSWWGELSRWAGPSDSPTRTVTELARECTNAPILVAASNVYLQAIADDLIQAKDALADPDLLIIVSAGTRPAGPLSKQTLPIDATMIASVGGTMRSINARIALKILSDSRKVRLVASALGKHYSKLQSSLPKFKRVNGSPMTDRQVVSFIKASMKESPEVSKTRLLAELRESGLACEQDRFSELFNSALLLRKER